MRDIHFLYGIATLAVVGILACFIGYITARPKASTGGYNAPSGKTDISHPGKPRPDADTRRGTRV